ncbi:hypothetical protein SEA_DRYAD_91 [Streptomyces phage Dryad]|nr:hypothetical protein SEA_DRYAD_91 [Streptomyces phage Dryad]
MTRGNPVPPPNNGHEPAAPVEADPVVQAETRGHTPAEQVQPPDADAVDLYGDI